MIDYTTHEIDMVLYHANCRDGSGAAWAAWKRLGNRATYIPCKYGDPPPDVSGRSVIILDFSYSREIVKKMHTEASDIIILDHHKSAMEDLGDLPFAWFSEDHSGAFLAWHFFHPGEEIPKFIRYIEDRDLWKWELPYSREFSAAFETVPYDFMEYDKFCDDSVFDDAVERGTHMLAYMRAVVGKICEGAVHQRFDGMDVMVVNATYWVSEIGNALAPHCDFAAIWHYDHRDRNIRVSLRTSSESIDISEIARRFNGGGHRKAGGFTLPGNANVNELFGIRT